MSSADDDLQKKRVREARLQPEADLSAILDGLHSSLCEAYEEYEEGCELENIEKKRLGIRKALVSFTQAAKFFGFSQILLDPINRLDRALVYIHNGYPDSLLEPGQRQGRPIEDFGEGTRKGMLAAIAELFWLDARRCLEKPALDQIMHKASKEISKSNYLKKINGKELKKLRERVRGYKNPINIQKIEQDTYRKIVEMYSNEQNLLEAARDLIFRTNLPRI